MNKRSKKGCLSCKKLRIKCDEALPKCEYCRHTNRECQYPEPTIKKESAKRRPLTKVRTQKQQLQSKWSGVSAEYNSISQLSLPEFKRFICQHKDRNFDQFLFNQTLAKPHFQLSISKFEYKLLDFFHNFCIERFMLAINPSVGHIWKNEVPSLFLRSRLVRSSIFSFAALNLNPLCDLNQLYLETRRLEYINRFEPELSEFAVYDPSDTKTQNMRNIHSVTITYFLEATKLTKEMVKDSMSLEPSNSVENARQLAVSSILIFLLLIMQPDNLTPLVCWDKSESDFISISRGISHTIKHCIPILATSDFAGLFLSEAMIGVAPPNTSFPITRKLYKDLQLEYPEGDTTALERDDIIAAVDAFNVLLYRSTTLGSPYPVFRWLMVILENFRDLIYSRNLFALHTLFQYAAVNILMRFELFGEVNLFLAYMRWFKQHNLSLFGEWKYPVDNALFVLAHDKLKSFKSYEHMAEFDPELSTCEDLFVF